MLLDLVTPEQVAVLRSKLDAASGGRARPSLAGWLPTAVEPSDEGGREILAGIAGYLHIGGYREMFLEAGFEEAVARAEAGSDVDDLINALPPNAATTVGLAGTVADISDRLDIYARAGLDEVAIVPVTMGDPGGMRTLDGVRSLMLQTG